MSEIPAPLALPPEFYAELALLPAPGPADGADGPPGGPGGEETPPTLLDHSAAVARQLARVGKQQMKTAQEVSLLQSEVHALCAELRGALRDKEELADLLRRERDSLAGQNELLLREVLGLADLFDHALHFAQRSGDKRWIEELERLHKGMLQNLARLGLHEIPALGQAFDPTLHEVVETVPRAQLKKTPFAEARVHDVVEVAQRGYHLGGLVLRRARVITAAE